MPGSGWMSKMNMWKGTRGEPEHGIAPLRAAAEGNSLDTVLDLGVQALLDAAGGDRAGLWLAGDRRGESGMGRVIESKTRTYSGPMEASRCFDAIPADGARKHESAPCGTRDRLVHPLPGPARRNA